MPGGGHFEGLCGVCCDVILVEWYWVKYLPTLISEYVNANATNKDGVHSCASQSTFYYRWSMPNV